MEVVKRSLLAVGKTGSGVKWGWHTLGGGDSWESGEKWVVSQGARAAEVTGVSDHLRVESNQG